MTHDDIIKGIKEVEEAHINEPEFGEQEELMLLWKFVEWMAGPSTDHNAVKAANTLWHWHETGKVPT